MPKIAIPMKTEGDLQSSPSLHFGRSPFFMVYTTENKEFKLIKNNSNHFGGRGSPTDIVIDEGINALLAGGMGKHAIEHFQNSGIPVYKVGNKPIEELINNYMNNELQELTENCGQERGPDHDH